MPEPLAAAGADYLEQLLDAAISVPAAAGDPASARIAGSLLASLAARQEDERLEPFFARGAARPASYEIRCYDGANLVSRAEHAGVGQAIRAGGEWGAGEGHTAEIVARTHGGEERSVFLVRDRAPIYRLPERDADTAAAAKPEPDPSPTAAEVVETLRRMLAGMTVHVDATAIEAVVREAMDELRRGPGATSAMAGPSGAGTIDEMARAVAVQVANLIPRAADIADGVIRRMAAGPPAIVAGDNDRRPVPGEPGGPPTFEPLDPAAQDALAAEQTTQGQARVVRPPP